MYFLIAEAVQPFDLQILAQSAAIGFLSAWLGAWLGVYKLRATTGFKHQIEWYKTLVESLSIMTLDIRNALDFQLDQATPKPIESWILLVREEDYNPLRLLLKRSAAFGRTETTATLDDFEKSLNWIATLTKEFDSQEMNKLENQDAIARFLTTLEATNKRLLIDYRSQLGIDSPLNFFPEPGPAAN